VVTVHGEGRSRHAQLIVVSLHKQRPISKSEISLCLSTTNINHTGETHMNYALNLEGFEGQLLEVKPTGFFSGPQLLINGQSAAKGPKRGQMLLQRSDGRAVVAQWKPQVLGLDVPQLEVDGKQVNVVEPLKWYEWVWGGLPLLLIFLGGALGGIVGFVAFRINTQIFRSTSSMVLKFILTAGVSVLAVVIFLILVTLFSIALGN